MAATITALLELARNDASILAAGRCSLTEVLDEITATATTGGVTLTSTSPTSRSTSSRARCPRDQPGRRERSAVRRELVVISIATRPTRGRSRSGRRRRPGTRARGDDAIFEPGTTSATGSGRRARPGDRSTDRAVRGRRREVAADAPTTRFVVRLPRA